MTLIRLHNDDWGFETNCFACEPRNERGLRIQFFHDTDRGLVVADFELGEAFSGAPTVVHGGVTLTVLDEAMAWACIALGGQWAVTTETNTRFHRPVRVDAPHRVEARIVEHDDAVIRASAHVTDVTGRRCADAVATFACLGGAQVQRLLGIEVDRDRDDLDQ